MKLSINQGEVISTEHCKRICVFLWDWYSSLPSEVKECVEVVVVTPEKTHSYIVAHFKVVLSGKSGWKCEFSTQSTIPWSNKALDFKRLGKDLSDRLSHALIGEISTRKKVLSNFESLLLLFQQKEV